MWIVRIGICIITPINDANVTGRNTPSLTNNPSKSDTVHLTTWYGDATSSCTTFVYMFIAVMPLILPVILFPFVYRRTHFNSYRKFMSLLKTFKQINEKDGSSSDISDGQEVLPSSKDSEWLQHTTKIEAMDKYFHCRKKSTTIYFTYIPKVKESILTEQLTNIR